MQTRHQLACTYVYGILILCVVVCSYVCFIFCAVIVVKLAS